jgi:hypothetical protein
VIQVFINGLPVSSLFCYTALLCLHQCLPTCLPCTLYSSALSLIWSVTTPCLLCLLQPLSSVLVLHIPASMLCSLFLLCNQQHPLFCFSSHFYALCYLLKLSVVPLIFTTISTFSPYSHMHISTTKALCLLCSACLSHAQSSSRSSWKLFVFSGGYAECVHHQWALL